MIPRRVSFRIVLIAACGTLLPAIPVAAQSPPALRTCFPAGCQIGQSVEITVGGDHLQSVSALQISLPRVECQPLDSSRFRLRIPADAPTGHCDLWAVSDAGISAPVTLVIGNRAECLEAEPNDSAAVAQSISTNTVVNGRIDKASDEDWFRLSASVGQRVIIECEAERIDSPLRAILQVFDTTGRRLAVNRGYFGRDPLIDFRAPDDGQFLVCVQELMGSGSEHAVYRLSIDCGPRVVCAVPNVVQRGSASRITLYGWNLQTSDHGTGDTALERIDVELPATLSSAAAPLPARLLSTQSLIACQSLAWHFPGSHAPVVIGITDVPVVRDQSDNHAPAAAQELSIPCEVSGQLVAGDERDWFVFAARRGEVIYLEAFGQRIQSPVDLQIGILRQSHLSEPQELAQFGDEVRNIGGVFRMDHLDPSGRWVCPADGRYLIVIHNVIGGIHADPRRVYRLSVRREEPDVQVVAVPHGDPASGINIRRNGRTVLDLFAIRRRGLNGSVRVSASDLPSGVEFEDVWLGPGVCTTTGVVSADRNAGKVIDQLKLDAFPDDVTGETRPVIGGTSTGLPTPYAYGRLTSQMRMAVAGEASIRLTADAHRAVDHHLYGTLSPRHSPGGIVDVAVTIDREDAGHEAPVRLIAVGLPDLIENQTATVPAGRTEGYLSFYLPPTLSEGHYSFVIRAETTVPNSENKPEAVTIFSNPVTIDVQPAAFLVHVDPFAVTQARRGEVFQIPYHVTRLNGFIGKTHTELGGPGVITDVPGLRGRGVTFVGQTDQGSIQVEVNGDAELGQQQFLRLFTVGVVEDEPVFHGSRFLTLEITD